MTPAELRRQLRTGQGRFLDARRRMAGLPLVASASTGLISLYQLGAIERLPDLPFALFATPDGVLGLANYAATLALIAAGGRDRAREHSWLPLALAAKLTLGQWTKHRAFRIWCLLGASATSSACRSSSPKPAPPSARCRDTRH